MVDFKPAGQMLRKFRKRRGFSQEKLLDHLSILSANLPITQQEQFKQLGIEIGFSMLKSELSRYENGHVAPKRPLQLFFIYGLKKLKCIEILWEANQWMDLSGNGNLSDREKAILWGDDPDINQFVTINQLIMLQTEPSHQQDISANTLVEIKLERDFTTFTEKEYSQFGRALIDLLHIKGITIRSIANGSVRIFIELPSDRVDALQMLFHTGKLQAYAVTAVRVLTEAEYAKIVETYENKYEAIPVPFEAYRQGWFATLWRWSVIRPVWAVVAATVAILILIVLRPWGTPPEITETNPDARYMVAAVQGELLRSRPGWSDYQPVTEGALLEPNDTLRTGPGTVAQLVCADLSLVEIPADYNGPAPCPATTTPLLTAQSDTIQARTMGSPTCSELPVLLTPRRTAIQTTQPLLRWQSTTGPYTVAIRELQWSSDAVDATELHYPIDAPPLQPDTYYEVTITDANECLSSDETDIDLSFHLLSPEKITEVEGHVTQIAQLNLPDDIENVLRAELYATYKLHTDAIELLTTATATSLNPNFHERLGDLYLAVIRYEAAQSAYEAALVQYQELQDQVGAAGALVGLGQALYGQGEDVLAIEQLRQAQTLYRALGDDDGIEQVQVLLEDMGG